MKEKDVFNSLKDAFLERSEINDPRFKKSKTCPRCKVKNAMCDEEVMNALSRRDNKTYICSPCGAMEALIDFAGFDNTPQEELLIEKDFIELILRRKINE